MNIKILKNIYCWFLFGGHDFWKNECLHCGLIETEL